MAELVAILLITAILTVATKSGRNLVKSAHQATGWRTPRAAMHHHSGRLGALAGRGIAATARASRRAAKRAGQHATTSAARRWQARRAAGTSGGTGEQPAEGTPQVNNTTCPECGEPAVHRSPDDLVPYRAHGTTPPEWSHPDGSALCPVMTPDGYRPAVPATPGTPGGTAQQEPATPPGAGPDPAPATTPTTASAPAGAERSTNPMSTRFAINLEHPTTDGEFLESCVQLGDALKSLAGQIGEWADGLSALNLPRSVLNPLHQVSEGITDAADGATQAATAFENEFEDARDVAARGMTITGQDAA